MLKRHITMYLAACLIAVSSLIPYRLMTEEHLTMAAEIKLTNEVDGPVNSRTSANTGSLPTIFTKHSSNGFDFEGVTYVSWTKGEYPFTTSWKPQTYINSQAITDILVATHNPFSGIGSLEMAIDLIGSHTNNGSGEVFIDLRYHPPLCDPPGCIQTPVDFEGITISAKVFGSDGSLGDSERPNGFQLFAKDENWRSFYGNWQNIREEEWMTVTVTPERTPPPNGYMDPGFDPTKIILLGLKVGAGSGSTASFSGLVWLDDVDWPGGRYPKYGFENVDNSLDKLEKMGVNYVALIDTWYMDHLTSTVIYSDSMKSHTDGEITLTIQEIHSRGMGVLLKPHVDVQDGTWRGMISPTDPVAWCNNYKNFIVHFAKIAQNTGVEQLSVGVELESMSGSQHRSCWDSVIDAVTGIYSGELTYAANWDNYANVSFWDRVDTIGIDVYFPISDARDPSLMELMAGWDSWIAQIETWQASISKPVIFTEIGYRNIDFCAKEPWGFGDKPPSNCQCQARAYEAALKALTGKPWFRGMFWWNWHPWSDAGGCCETSFTPQNKQAQQILTCLYGACLYMPVTLSDY